METRLSLIRNSQKENPEEPSGSKTQRKIFVGNLSGVDFIWEKGSFNTKDINMRIEFD